MSEVCACVSVRVDSGVGVEAKKVGGGGEEGARNKE
jgi:hypothetical protein